MSFLFGGGRPQPSSAEKLALAEAELELIQDMYSKLAASCTAKCIPKEYREGELNKGESVCIDRCVAKYMDVNIKVGEKMQGAALERGGGAAGGGGAAPGGGFGGFGR
ncbi:MAG: protein transporter tim10 [Chrysothrix sp. TS-e1954]|nr:MAG: protein transporter tim10 [Chrysothrix sp. TS-e1954]